MNFFLCIKINVNVKCNYVYALFFRYINVLHSCNIIVVINSC